MSVARNREQLRAAGLRSVSRSFYLSLRFLPKPLRDPLSLAYLLARVTDTIADTTQPPAPVRMGALRDLAAAGRGPAPTESMDTLRNSLMSQHSHAAERKLIEQI